eukprot:CAMPEP_0169193112 /NCGR_PEP_ID=MMETSP1016-20121227/5987_1 /TAXON_ID=342587 /ORGANISM="Karlodinium micrum, Strain CCMP2283" /LENGTH=267 /DNA_ID=CAMNT_0009269523 /DNA_START=168 /DNA_END=971 /DNA_ORIENTATION=+
MMESRPENLILMITGVKILGQLFGDCEDLDDASRDARVIGVQTITKTMQAWPQETHLVTHSCYALSAFALHGIDPAGSSYSLQHVQHALRVAWTIAVPLANALDQQCEGSRQRARYLRQEIGRLEMESVKVASEPARQELRTEALRIGAAATQCTNLLQDAFSNRLSAAELIDCMRMALTVLGVLGNAMPVVEVMKEGGPRVLALARAAAEASVDLCRLGLQAELKCAGLADVVRGVRDGWHRNGNHGDQDVIESLSCLQFAEDWFA